MPPPLALLVLYPVVLIVAPIVFYLRGPKDHPQNVDVSANDNESEKMLAVRQDARLWLFIYGILLCGTTLLLMAFPLDLDNPIFFASSNIWSFGL